MFSPAASMLIYFLIIMYLCISLWPYGSWFTVTLEKSFTEIRLVQATFNASTLFSFILSLFGLSSAVTLIECSCDFVAERVLELKLAKTLAT